MNFEKISTGFGIKLRGKVWRLSSGGAGVHKRQLQETAWTEDVQTVSVCDAVELYAIAHGARRGWRAMGGAND
ncbi:MAG: hypothetical protein KDD78_16720 [Caldilineaceae bacterium]|nr:hypothetical protein [Caldilineaceae bacterium]